MDLHNLGGKADSCNLIYPMFLVNPMKELPECTIWIHFLNVFTDITEKNPLSD